MSDLISRQQAIDTFLVKLTEQERKSLKHMWTTVEVKYFTAKILEQLPSAQPQRKGQWIILPPIFEEICQCSKCKMKFKDALQWTNYCPSCGARMDGESE